ncbi:hypothetical protein [Spartinivicinus ruber]|uniref:hypothetical protein n=1 Tax=Spartinivicinus ruber TaxID=2683272 RepID=UPI0013D501FB|nr:hypothetical protein [Spartinivicinus ruber]
MRKALLTAIVLTLGANAYAVTENPIKASGALLDAAASVKSAYVFAPTIVEKECKTAVKNAIDMHFPGSMDPEVAGQALCSRTSPVNFLELLLKVSTQVEMSTPE